MMWYISQKSLLTIVIQIASLCMYTARTDDHPDKSYFYLGVALHATACENEVLTVSCSEQDVIQVINAHYGRLEENTCASNIGTLDTECLVAGAHDIVYNRSVMIADFAV